jgi:hypothetical protein
VSLLVKQDCSKGSIKAPPWVWVMGVGAYFSKKFKSAKKLGYKLKILRASEHNCGNLFSSFVDDQYRLKYGENSYQLERKREGSNSFYDLRLNLRVCSIKRL